MKTSTLIIIAAAIGLSGAAHAQNGKGERGERKLPPEILEKFDKNGDGKLDEEERKAAREAMAEMRANREKEMLAKYDKNGDGKLDGEERKIMRENMRKMMHKRFDNDGDGELNEEERAEMRKAMGVERAGGLSGPRGPRGNGDRPNKGGSDAEAHGAGE